MKVEFDTKDGQNPFESIVEEIKRLPELTQAANKKALLGIGKIIKKNVKKRLNKSADVVANYDGTQPYVHMVDDIKVTVDIKSGFDRVIVRGGKYTGYKWHLVDDGTLSKNGKPHTRATHFTTGAMADSEAEIERYIDQIIAEVANGG